MDSFLWSANATIDYDLFYPPQPCSPEPCFRSTELPAPYQTELSENEDYPFGRRTAQGLQAEYERIRWELKEVPSYLFSDTTEWMANIWLSGNYRVSADEKLPRTEPRTYDTLLMISLGGKRHITGSSR